jgi:tetratricopeptide (TPR) repeat protein
MAVPPGSPRYRAALADLGARLRRVRVALGLSLRSMARELGTIGHSALLDYEHGRRLIPDGLLARYGRLDADALASLTRARDAVLRARADELPAGADPAATTDPATLPAGMGAQLPADLPDFVGRGPELAAMTSWLADRPADRPGERLGAPTVVCVHGPAGMGKTSLAVHFAHRSADRFPDGQLLVELHGAGTHLSGPGQVLESMLVALGVPRQRIPPGVEARAGLFRSVVAGRRLLLVLDDARGEDQVRPLLPGTADSLVLVTSRGPLTGLDGARQVPLDVLDTGAALDLFRQVVGAHRVAAEIAETRQIVSACGNLPLATRLAAARMLTWPAGTLREWAEELAERTGRLDRLQAGDRAVRGAFDASYQASSPAARTLFRRLSLAPGPDFDAALAAVLTGVDTGTTAGTDDDADRSAGDLAELATYGLVQPATATGRYRMHDLLRLFADERLLADEAPRHRHAVQHRMLTYLLSTAADAGSSLDPSGYSTPSPTSRFRRAQQAVRWLDNERHSVLAAVRRARDLDRPDLVFPLIVALPWYWDLRCLWEDWQEVNGHALALARDHGDRAQQVIAHNGLSVATRQLGDAHAAAQHARAALDLARDIGRTDEAAGALDRLGCALSDLGDYAAAIGHHTEAVRLNQRLGDRWAHAAAARHLGYALHAAGRTADAAVQLCTAIDLFDRLGAARSQAMTECWYGDVLLDLGDADAADRQYRTALERFATQDDRWGVALAHLGLGRCLGTLGEADRAATALTTAVDTFAAMRDGRYHAAALQALAALPGPHTRTAT